MYKLQLLYRQKILWCPIFVECQSSKFSQTEDLASLHFVHEHVVIKKYFTGLIFVDQHLHSKLRKSLYMSGPGQWVEVKVQKLYPIMKIYIPL